MTLYGIRKRLAWVLRRLAERMEPGCYEPRCDDYASASSWPLLRRYVHKD